MNSHATDLFELLDLCLIKESENIGRAALCSFGLLARGRGRLTISPVLGRFILGYLLLLCLLLFLLFVLFCFMRYREKYLSST